jgi:hypothetical protein
MTKPVDGEDAYNSFVEYFDGFPPWRINFEALREGDFLIAVAQYEMRAYLVPDTATNAMNLVLSNLEVARQLGQEYISTIPREFIPSFPREFIVISSFLSSEARDLYTRSRVGPSRSISDARAALAIDDSVELTVDVVEAAFERDAALMVVEGEKGLDCDVVEESIEVLKFLRQARSLLLRSLE